MPAMTDVTVDAIQDQDNKPFLADYTMSEDVPWMSATVSSDVPGSSGHAPGSFSLTDVNAGGDTEQTSVTQPSPASWPEVEPSPLFPIPYTDIPDTKAVQGVAGLRNLGNTCFMNSGLQCLVSIPRLSKFFLQDFTIDDCVRDTLTGQFAELLNKVWGGQYSMIHPSQFKQVLGMYHPHFSDYRQHDCQEFLALLLDSLHEQLNKAQDIHKSWDLDRSSPAETVMSSAQDNQSDLSSEPELNNADQSAGASKVELNNARAETSPASDQSDSIELDAADQSQCSKEDVVNPMPEPVQPLSEDSNQSENSLQSTGDQSHRLEGIPESVKPFGCPPEGAVSMEVDSVPGDDVEKVAEAGRDGDDRKLPSLEDLYMKDTKTLNTNVLATEYMAEDVATDSEKFHKPDNNSHSPQAAATELFENFEQLNDLLTYDTTKDASLKPIKDTNLLANMKEKFAEDCYDKCLFSEVVGAMGCEPRDGIQKKLLFSQLEADDASYSINNIKRMKIDEDEKNLRMQAQLKVNTDIKPTNLCSNLTLRTGPLADQAMAIDRDQSLSQQGTSYPREHAVVPLPNQLREKDDLKQAERAWRRYVRANRSVIVDTFQGQFKSTVVCAECQHISVTYEPFMYLSVPLPHAMERQISVLFVPCDNKQPVRYLLTLNKQDRVSKLKTILVKMIGEETCDLIMAEVFDNHISRILEDNTVLRYVNDATRMVYAIEMMPPPQLDDITTESDDVTTQSTDITSSTDVPPNNMMSPSSKPPLDPQSQDVFSNVGNFAVPDSDCGWESYDKLNKDRDPVISAGRTSLDYEANILNNLATSPTPRWGLGTTADFQENLLLSPAESGFRDPGQIDTGVHQWESTTKGETSGNWDQEPEAGTSTQSADVTAAAAGETAETGDAYTQGDVPTEEEGDAVKTDQWRSCAICLEEMADCDLMVHTSCDGTLCQSCLEMSFKHYGDVAFTCPVCSSPASPLDDFIQLSSMADYKPRTRILSVPVVHRVDEGKDKMKLFGHPNILYLPSKMTGEFLYESVDRVVPCLSQYSIILTDGQGYHCSRCLYTQHCSGCELVRDAEEVQLQPGDNLAVRFIDLTCQQMDSAYSFSDHKSMSDMRSDEPLTLYDCFTAFTESERLDEHNPWFCPCCKKNQCANKTMTVCRYPENLVVYLKRFVFHDLASTKVDSKVVFPLENLDLSDYVSGTQQNNLVYDLQACVCHFGGASAGHYTAYARHPVLQEWHYFNDETQLQQKPQENDFSNAYILFYQKQGTKVNFTMPEKIPACEDISKGSQDGTSSLHSQPASLQSSPVQSEAKSQQPTSLPQSGDTSLQSGTTLPQSDDTSLQSGTTLPQSDDTSLQSGTTSLQSDDTSLQSGTTSLQSEATTLQEAITNPTDLKNTEEDAKTKKLASGDASNFDFQQ